MRAKNKTAGRFVISLDIPRAANGEQDLAQRVGWLRGECEISRLAFKKRHAGEHFALEKLEAGAAAGGAVGDLAATLNFFAAVAVSPPPTTVVAPAAVAAAMSAAMAWVEAANFSNSKTPAVHSR